ncbi:MAG: sigma-70 family RNA polymerase sigma factor [Verrucomicrobiaceae bacterium]|nr:MAG: sigma-70 family RNA polymerase sigma factor [Verrucomicrobiaceae bacterium]
MASPSSTVSPNGRFEATQWSVILAAGGDDSLQVRDALERLCSAYWYPLYAFLRRMGHSAHDAEDLTQGFLTDLIHRRAIAKALPEHGRFRSFLIASLKNYLSHQRERESAQKRGGQQVHLSLDAVTAEERYKMEPVEGVSPADLYDRRWALTVLDNALSQMRLECEQTGKGALFAALSPMLVGGRASVSLERVEVQIGMAEGAVKVALHRLRQKFRESLRSEVARTVSDPNDVDAERRHLLSAIG